MCIRELDRRRGPGEMDICLLWDDVADYPFVEVLEKGRIGPLATVVPPPSRATAAFVHPFGWTPARRRAEAGGAV